MTQRGSCVARSSSTVGTTTEWYDFFLYSIVTGLVFAKLYFPKSDPLTGTLEAFDIYAVGLLARPGKNGDCHHLFFPGVAQRDGAVEPAVAVAHKVAVPLELEALLGLGAGE